MRGLVSLRKVVRFVDHHQILKLRQLKWDRSDIAGIPVVARQVGVREQRIAKAVGGEWVIDCGRYTLDTVPNFHAVSWDTTPARARFAIRRT